MTATKGTANGNQMATTRPQTKGYKGEGGNVQDARRISGSPSGVRTGGDNRSPWAVRKGGAAQPTSTGQSRLYSTDFVSPRQSTAPAPDGTVGWARIVKQVQTSAEEAPRFSLGEVTAMAMLVVLLISFGMAIGVLGKHL